MKTNAALQSSFLFNPEFAAAGPWPVAVQPVRQPRRPSPRFTETQIDYKQEFICGIILILCLLFGLSVSIAQFTLA